VSGHQGQLDEAKTAKRPLGEFKTGEARDRTLIRYARQGRMAIVAREESV